MALEALIAAGVIGLSEIADKTQLAILALAIHFRKPWPVFLGALSAHTLLDAVAVLIGTGVGTQLPLAQVKLGAGIFFTLLGARTLVRAFSKPHARKATRLALNPFSAAFLTIFISEFGDKTQLASALLGATYGAALQIILGLFAALVLAIGFTVFLGSRFAEHVPRRTIKIATGALFIAFGIWNAVAGASAIA